MADIHFWHLKLNCHERSIRPMLNCKTNLLLFSELLTDFQILVQVYSLGLESNN